ncbi:CHRD domain-containing protein [Halorussus sp. MSC15.2]|uniref:CHRD domain-containing protein n=1 Tax=Halorussus sp. MSC15.2 TaxID=2283638 RepID=UPI0013D038BF|nr:CHRD domain-containing protein [Halorussus sp. MSC15.2]NEU55405.1 CHRD domain-containing protein [Halorussus sp. MSC15.2]
MTDDSTDHRTRRTFLSAAATSGALLGVGSITDVGTVLATGRRQDVATHYRLGGKVAGWQGIEPPSIAQAVNPVLNLEAGKRYAVTWKNLDGAPHNFAIIGQNGDVLLRTEIISGTGATQTTQFTASEQMDVYVCQVHPNSMRGQIAMGAAPPQGNQTTVANQTPTTIPNPTEVAENETTHPLADEFGENPQKFIAEFQPADGVQTNARGTTYFVLHPPNGEEPKLMYSLYLQNIENVTGAGIYLDTQGSDPLVAPLFQPENPTDQIEGSLVDSLLVAEDLRGPFAQETLLRLVEAIRNDKVYVQVSTAEHPDGVLRGPIRAVAETGGETLTTDTPEGGNQTTVGNQTTATTETTAANDTAAQKVDTGELAQQVRAPGFGVLTALGGLGGYLLSRSGDD